MIIDNTRPAFTTTTAGTTCPGGPSYSTPSCDGPGLDLAIETVSLGVEGACADHSLMLAFDTATDMVASYSLVARPGSMREAARTAVDALRELHVSEHVEVDITCGRYPLSTLVGEIKRMSGRAKVAANDGWNGMLSFDHAAAEIGRQVRGVAAYELAAGWAGFDGPDERRFFLECVVDQVLYWYHRRPSSTPGFKSPIERLAARNAGTLGVPTFS